MGIPENIKKLRAFYGLTQTELGKIAGVSDKAIWTWENGTAEPRMGAIQKIADHFNIKKSVIIDEHADEEISNLSNITNISFPAARPIPMLGDICAGNGIFCEENFDGYFFMDQSIKADFCVRVRGNSMIDACIFNNDIAFIKKTYDYKNNTVYAVLLNSECEATLKKVFWQGNTIILSPCNSEFEPMVIDASEVTILGECVGVFRNMK